MSRDWPLYLGDLIESGEKIERFVTGRTFETFLSDEAIFDAEEDSEVVKKSPKQNFITLYFNDLQLGKVEFFTASQNDNRSTDNPQ